MTLKKTVIVLSDDYFYLKGLEYLLKYDNHMDLFCHYIYQNKHECFFDNVAFDIVAFDINNGKSIIILAVDDLSLIRKFATHFSANVIYSLRTIGKREMILHYKGALVINRCLSIWRMLEMIKRYGKVCSMTSKSLTPKEEQVIFNYFNLPGCQFKDCGYEAGIKKISHYKRSAYQKIMVNGDGEAYFLVRALNQISAGQVQPLITSSF